MPTLKQRGRGVLRVAGQDSVVEIGNELAYVLFAAITCYLFNFCENFNGFIGNQGR